MDNVQYMFSEKGKIVIIKKDFKFCFHKELNNERWKCIKKQCKAYIGKITKFIIIKKLIFRFLKG